MTEAEQILSDELIFDLNDPGSKAYYRKIVKIYDHDFLRETKRQVLLKEGLGNKGAYFTSVIESQGYKHLRRR